MLAARLHAYGPPQNLVLEQVPDPRLERATDVRILVHAASINPIDWKIRSGHNRAIIRPKFPAILGLDVSGEVVEVGAKVTRFKVGDLVYGCPDHRRPGSYAEQVVVDEAFLALKPPSLTHAEAATLPLVGLTSWQCLVPKLAERSGQRVLIQAGSGGVGTFAIQLAKHHGAWVATTASKANHELVTSLGADRPIDYRSENWSQVVLDLDIVLENIGVDDRSRAFDVVKRGGRIASIASGIPDAVDKYGSILGVVIAGLGIVGFWLRGKVRGIDAATVIKQTRGDQLEQITALVEAKVIRPVVDKTFPLAEIAAAHAYGETGRIRGKVAIIVR